MGISSLSIAGWIANGVLCVLLLRAWIELRPRTAVIFGLLWLVGYLGLPFILYGEPYFMPYVALLDIVILLLLSRQREDGLRLR